jgi:hypothetical protein
MGACCSHPEVDQTNFQVRYDVIQRVLLHLQPLLPSAMGTSTTASHTA